MVQFHISNHALRQYRARVLGCRERHRSDACVKAAMLAQIKTGRMQRAQGCLVVGHGPSWKQSPYLMVIDDAAVVTTLGFMMMPSKKRSRRHKARRARDRTASIEPQVSVAHANEPSKPEELKP